jgi:MarR family transcriptional regulator, organic hydroperoxide resistance regulator
MKKRGSNPDVLEVMQSLWALAHALEARSKWMHRNLGVTGPQRLLLRAIGETPGCSPGDAAGLLSLDPGTVSRLAAGLEQAGLLRRNQDRSDGRRLRLVLTRRGEALNRKQGGTVEAAVRETLASAKPGESRVACQFVHRLTESLEVKPSGNGRRAAAASCN